MTEGIFLDKYNRLVILTNLLLVNFFFAFRIAFNQLQRELGVFVIMYF